MWLRGLNLAVQYSKHLARDMVLDCIESYDAILYLCFDGSKRYILDIHFFLLGSDVFWSAAAR